MPISFENIDSEAGEGGKWIWERIFDTIRESHYPLLSAEIGLLALFASKYVGKPPELTTALKQHGLPVPGIVKLVSANNRAAGMPADAQLIFDRYVWEKLTVKQRCALIDSLLESIEVKLDGEGEILRHDDNRPKLYIKPCDVVLLGRKVIAERHGEHSLEKLQMDNAIREMGQLSFNFAQARNETRELLTDKLLRQQEQSAPVSA